MASKQQAHPDARKTKGGNQAKGKQNVQPPKEKKKTEPKQYTDQPRECRTLHLSTISSTLHLSKQLSQRISPRIPDKLVEHAYMGASNTFRLCNRMRWDDPTRREKINPNDEKVGWLCHSGMTSADLAGRITNPKKKEVCKAIVQGKAIWLCIGMLEFIQINVFFTSVLWYLFPIPCVANGGFFLPNHSVSRPCDPGVANGGLF
jgi:hypothetical protein